MHHKFLNFKLLVNLKHLNCYFNKINYFIQFLDYFHKGFIIWIIIVLEEYYNLYSNLNYYFLDIIPEFSNLHFVFKAAS